MSDAMTSTDAIPQPLALVAVEMGYGHLRAAYALAGALGCEVLHADRPPLASPEEERRWRRVRSAYEGVSRLAQAPLVGRPFRRALDAITAVPHLYPRRDQSAPNAAVRALERLSRAGLGDRLIARLGRSGATLLTTFYAPAIRADLSGIERILCVVTDSDINRVWAPRDAARSRIHYCVPSERAMRRLRAYGVPPERIHVTGFPLPTELLGGEGLPALRRCLAERLVRLDPAGAFHEQYRDELAHFLGPLADEQRDRAPLVTYAVGGAGAQAGVARHILRSLRAPLAQGSIRLALVAGVRGGVAASFRRWIQAEGLTGQLGGAVEILHTDDLPRYFERFNALLARTDILWTKPSELTFYGALGIPLVFAWPVGVHERLNRRWAIQRGAGLKQDNPRYAWQWLREWLQDGTLAAAAWSGYMRLPKFGTYRIAELSRDLAPRPAG